MPPEAYDSFPGEAFAAFTISATVLNGESVRTVSMSGPRSMRMIGTRSLIGSKLSFLNSAWFTASGAKFPMPMV